MLLRAAKDSKLSKWLFQVMAVDPRVPQVSTMILRSSGDQCMLLQQWILVIGGLLAALYSG